MITLKMLQHSKHDTLWHVAYNGQLIEVTTQRRRAKHRINEMRHAIWKATNVRPSQIKFVSNRRIVSKWATEWKIV